MPSRDVAADSEYFADMLGGRIVFAIEAMGARVSMIELTEEALAAARELARDLEGSLAELERRGWKRERTFEIPHGPCCSFGTPGGHRIAVYQLTRPEVDDHFGGRRDF